MLKWLKAALLAVASLFVFAAPPANASTILVGQCIEFDTCYSSQTPTPWSDSLSLADLTSLGLGSIVDFTAWQTAQFIIRLGVTSITFQTSGAPVTETLPEFNGTLHNDPCNFCEIDLVGTFLIPVDATSAIISGTFGNSTVPNSAGVNLCLETAVLTAPNSAATGACVARAPEPGTLALLGLALAGVAATGRRRIR